MFTSVVRNERAENTNNEGKDSHSEHSRTEGNRYGADQDEDGDYGRSCFHQRIESRDCISHCEMLIGR